MTVVLDSPAPAQWVISTLEKLDQHQNIELNQIIVQSTPDDSQHKKPRQTALYRVARKLLYGYINRPRFDANIFESHPLPAKFHTLARAAGDDSVNEHSPTDTCDIVLHLGDLNRSSSRIPKAKHGTWIVKHKELTDRIEETVSARRPLLWIHLWRVENYQTGALYRIGSHALPMQSYSITDVLSYGFGSLPNLIESRLNWLAHGYQPEQFEADQIEPKMYPQYAFPDDYKAPHMSGIELSLRTFILLCLQTKQRLRDKLQSEEWQLSFRLYNHHASDIELSEYHELKPPAKSIWSDPHLIVENDQTHVFFEELVLSENRGRIAWAVLTPTGFENEPQTVLEEDHHLSYPFVFKHQNDFYMVPETAARRTISLYKATSFPDQWERVSNIMDNIDAADSTLFKKDGLWWLFTNGSSHPSVDERDQLMLFYSTDVLSGDWHPHPLNPVVTGVDRARMAGPIYTKDGEWFRPSQYGATRYGFGINISKIHSLSTTEYKETLISRLSPNTHDVWLGCHTALHGEEITVIDRLRRVKR